MLIPLSSPVQPATIVGHKAAKLMTLTAHDFAVPTGWVVPAAAWTQTLDQSGLNSALNQLLKKVTPSNTAQVATAIETLLRGLTLPDELVAELTATLPKKTAFAVRSSGTQEDLAATSFAGQYDSFGNVSGAPAVAARVLDVYRAVFSARNLTYALQAGVSLASLKMAVLIQTMVPATLSGVVFTLDPVTGADTLTLNLTTGNGAALMDGTVAATTHHYDDATRAWTPALPAEFPAAECATVTRRIEALFETPCDIEFAWANGQLAILQARPITAIGTTAYAGQWTTANFRDGGVAATVCTPFMWSLYDAAWTQALGDYLRAQRLVTAPPGALIRYAYARPYWNATAVKSALAQLPGYVEGDFDRELGLQPPADGIGVTTHWQWRAVPHVLRIALAHTRERNAFNRAALGTLAAIDARQEAAQQALTTATGAAVVPVWQALVTADHLLTEGTYFTQVYHNTIDQTLLKATARRHLTEPEYLQLLGGLRNVSHLRLQHALWAYTARFSAAERAWWLAQTESELSQAVAAGTLPHAAAFASLLADYGYHGPAELRVETPRYAEKPALLLHTISALLAAPDAADPTARLEAQEQAAASAQAKLLAAVPSWRRRGLRKTIARLRTMLWWREEFKDRSTRGYALIHTATLRLGEWLTERGVLAQADDVWFATTAELRAYLDGGDPALLAESVAAGRRTYTRFTRFTPPEALGAAQSPAASPAILEGLGSSAGAVTAPVRVLHDASDIAAVRPGEILVTRSTDTGWIHLFPTLAGIVTETGGILCHAAVCAREFGLPCIVCATDATAQLHTGMTVTMDGATGAITPVDA